MAYRPPLIYTFACAREPICFGFHRLTVIGSTCRQGAEPSIIFQWANWTLEIAGPDDAEMGPSGPSPGTPNTPLTAGGDWGAETPCCTQLLRSADIKSESTRLAKRPVGHSGNSDFKSAHPDGRTPCQFALFPKYFTLLYGSENWLSG